MKKKRSISKVIFIVFSIFSIIALILVLIIFSLLPGPKEIKSGLSSPPKENTLKGQEDKMNKGVRSDSNALPVEISQEDQEREEIAQEKKRKQDEINLIKRLMVKDNNLSVCENLREDSSYEVGPNPAEVDFGTLFVENSKNDPILDTFRYPLVFVFQDENLSSLMNDIFDSEIADADESNKSSILEKMDFYAKATKTAFGLRSRKKEFEMLADRTEHLRILAMISQLKKDQAYDSNFLETCNSLQQSIMNNDEIDIIKERDQIVKIIKKSGLEPKDLNFNPKNFAEYQVKFSKEGLQFRLDSEDDKKEDKI